MVRPKNTEANTITATQVIINFLIISKPPPAAPLVRKQSKHTFFCKVSSIKIQYFLIHYFLCQFLCSAFFHQFTYPIQCWQRRHGSHAGYGDRRRISCHLKCLFLRKTTCNPGTECIKRCRLNSSRSFQGSPCRWFHTYAFRTGEGKTVNRQRAE